MPPRRRKKSSEPEPLTETIRRVIAERELTPYAVSKASGVDTAVVYRFIHRERDVTGATLDRLAMALRLEVREIEE